MSTGMAKILGLLAGVMVSAGVWGQTTVTTQTANMNATPVQNNTGNSFAGTYDNGAELANYANQNNGSNTTPGAAAYRTFSNNQTANNGTPRTLRPGDRFIITVFSIQPTTSGVVGISFKNNTTFSSVSDYTSGQICRFEMSDAGGWKIVHNGGTIENAGATAGTDRTLQIDVTSSNTFDATISGTVYRNLSFMNTGPIASFCIYNIVTTAAINRSNPNSFWKNASLQGRAIEFYTPANSTISGIISNGGGENTTNLSASNMTHFGGNNLTLSGANSYTGTTTVDNGELWIANGGSLSSSSTIIGNAIANTAKLWLSHASGGTTFTNNIIINTGNANTREIGGLNTSGTHTFSGNITHGSNNGLIITALNNGGTLQISGVISGSNPKPVTFSGNGTIILSGNNTYVGTNTIQSGTTVRFGANVQALGGGSNTTTIQSGGVLDLNGFTLSNNKPLNLNGTGISGSGALINNPTVFSNVSYGGSVNIGSSTSIIAANGNITFSATNNTGGSGANLNLGGAYGGTFSPNITSGASGTLSKNGNGTWTLTGGSTYGGVSGSATTINAGTLQISGAADRLPIATALSIASGATFDLNSQNQQVGSLTSITTGGAVSLGSGTLTIGGNQTTSYSGTITGSGAIIKNGTSTLTLGSSLAGIAVTNGSGTGGGLVLNGNISGNSSITNTGLGTLTLNGTNNQTGLTTISAGTVTYTSAGSFSSGSAIALGGGTLAIGTAPTGTLNVGSFSQTFSSTINLGSGSNAFNLNFSGSTGLSGTLTILNWTTTAGKEVIIPGLSGAQLDLINFDGYGIGAKYDPLVTNRIVPKFFYVTISTGAGPFSATGSWLNGDIPNGNTCLSNPATIVIQSGFTLTQDVGYDFARIENNGNYIMSSAQTINLCGGGSFVNGTTGAVNFTDGTLVCAGAASFTNANTSASFVFQNITLNGVALLPANAPTIRGSLQINAGGAVTGNSPFYTNTSTLFYNAATHSRSLEWVPGVTAFTSAGYPNNVTIGSNTQGSALTLSTTAALQIGGNLTIGAASGPGSSANMPGTNFPLTVVRNVVINATGNLLLSNVSSGDLYIAGNFTNNGTFTHNQRAIFFNGTADQTISGTFTGTGTTNCLPFLVVNKATGRLLLGSALNVTGVTNPIVTLTNGNLVLGSNNLELSSSGTFAGAPFSTSKMVVADGSGQLIYNVPPASNISYFFPVGDVTVTTEYSPITISLNNTGAGGSFGLNVTNAAHPNINDPTTTKSINRYWSVTTSSLNSYTWAGNFSYLDADLQPLGATDEGNLRANVWYPAPGNGWELLGGGINTTNNVVTITGGNFGSLKDGAITARIYVPLYYITAGPVPSDWSLPVAWLVSTDPNFISPAGVPATFGPSHINSAAINIQQGHTINVTSDYTADELTLNGTLNIEAGTRFGLNNGAGTDLSISGTGRLNLNGGIYGSYFFSTTTVSTGGYFYNKLAAGNTTFLGSATFAANSTYQHDVNGGTIPTATWQTGSLVNITGITANPPGGLNQSFSNFTWNCANQSQAVSLSGNLTSVAGNLTVTSTGSSANELRVFSINDATSTLNIGGILTLEGGNMALTNLSSSTQLNNNHTINVTGLTMISGGSLVLAGSNATIGSGTATFNAIGGLDIGSSLSTLNLTANTAIGILNVAGNLNVSAGSIRKTGGGNGSLNLVKATGDQTVNIHSTGISQDNVAVNIGNGTTTNTVSLNANLALNAAAVITVLNNARLNSNTFITTGGAFNLIGGGTHGIGSPLGISTSGNDGNIQTTTRTFPSNANYVYNGSANQVTGSGLPSNITGSLQITNTGNPNNTVTLSNNGTTTSNLLLTSGSLAVGNGQTLNIANGGQIDIPASGGAGSQATGSDAGTINFIGGGNVLARQTGLPNLTNVITNGTVSFSGGQASNATINGFLQLNANSVISNSPFYATGSTLVYNTGGGYNREVEWGALSGPGYPHHVRIQGGTILNANLGALSTPTWNIGGNLELGTTGTTGSLNFNGGLKKMVVEGNVTIGGNFGTSTLTLGDFSGTAGDLEIGGSYTRTANGVINFGSGFGRAIFFTGPTNASIYGPSSSTTETFPYIIIDKQNGNANTVTLESPVTITNQITFTKGVIISNTNQVLEIGKNATATGGNAASFVKGPMRKVTAYAASPGPSNSQFIFIIGGTPSNLYRPVSINTLIPENTTDETSYTAEYRPGDAAASDIPLPFDFLDYRLLGVWANQWWDVTKSPSNHHNAGARVGINYTAGQDSWWPASPISASRIIVAKYNSGSQSWESSIPDGNFNSDPTQPPFIPYYESRLLNVSGVIYSDTLYTFSPFTVAFGSEKVLPLRLLTFSASLHGPDALLHWTLADAKDLKHFEVEHSADGQAFTRLANVGHNGGTSFNYRHAGLQPGVHYYRLKMVEKDGQHGYSKVELLMVNTNHTLITGLMQNPIQGGQAVLKIYSAERQDAEAVVLDMAGRMLLRQKLSLQTGYNQPSLSLLPLPSGMYKMLIRTSDGVEKVITVMK